MRSTLLLLALGACVEDEPNPADGGQFGEESGAHCVAVSSTPVALDEVSAVGMSPQEVHQLVEGDQGATLIWNDGGSSDLALSLTDLGDAAYVEYDIEDNGSGTEMELGCAAQLEIPASFSFVTTDGIFDEQADLTLAVVMAGEVPLWVDLETVSGTFNAADYADATYDEVWANIEATFNASGMSGAVMGVGESSSGSGDSGTVSATQFEIATF